MVFPDGSLVVDASDVVIDSEGNVTFPSDNEIERPNGDKIVITPPVVSYPDSEDKTEVTLPDGSLPTFDKDVNLILPPGTTYPVDKGTAELPNGGIVLPDGTVVPNFPIFVVTPDDDLIIEGEITVTPNPGWDKDDNGNIVIDVDKGTSVTDKDGNDKFPGGNGGQIIITPDGDIIFKPNKPETKPDKPAGDIGGGGGAEIGIIDKGDNNENDTPVEPVLPVEPDVDRPFIDVDDDYWADDAINDLYNKGIINGYNKMYRPEDNITRADFALILNNVSNYLGVVNTNIDEVAYSDIRGNEYYANAVYESTSRDIMIGYNNGKFKPKASITREESIVAISKLLKHTGKNVDNLGNYAEFTDGKDISWWASSYVDDLNDKGILTGYVDGTLRPKENLTRAETAMLIYKLLENIE